MIDVNVKLQRSDFTIDINERFASGITGVYGPSGSGKTSLLSLISGLESPDDGEISINNAIVYSASKKINVAVQKRNVGYVFQEGRLFPHMTVEQNLRFGLSKSDTALIGFDEVVSLLGLSRLLHQKPAHISGGERQRTALGRALLSSPSLLLLDEPFSALDAGLREQIIPFILKVHQRINIPILVVSHDISDLLKLTNTLFLIRSGRCVGHDDYLNLLKEPALKYAFGSNCIVNALPMRVSKVDRGCRLIKLAVSKGDQEVKIVCEKTKVDYQIDQTVKVFIRAEDIALSNYPLNEITIQNQLKGVVVDVVTHDYTVLCMVDVGFVLVVEITTESQKRMEIKLDSIVYCLFKSVAIDVAG